MIDGHIHIEYGDYTKVREREYPVKIKFGLEDCMQGYIFTCIFKS